MQLRRLQDAAAEFGSYRKVKRCLGYQGHLFLTCFVFVEG